jgi:hypothetical protein
MSMMGELGSDIPKLSRQISEWVVRTRIRTKKAKRHRGDKALSLDILNIKTVFEARDGPCPIPVQLRDGSTVKIDFHMKWSPHIGNFLARSQLQPTSGHRNPNGRSI